MTFFIGRSGAAMLTIRRGRIDTEAQRHREARPRRRERWRKRERKKLIGRRGSTTEGTETRSRERK
jgi:hypothetical protein